MPSNVSVAALDIRSQLSSPGLLVTDNACSPEASIVGQAIEAIRGLFETSWALCGPREDTVQQIRDLYIEYRHANWDGYDAAPISVSAAARAMAFIRALPADLALPELTADPDGSVALEWEASPTRTLTLSIGVDDRLAYAWLDGVERGHAVTVFTGAKVSSRVIEAIRGVTRNGASIGAV